MTSPSDDARRRRSTYTADRSRGYGSALSRALCYRFADWVTALRFAGPSTQSMGWLPESS
jgi:hypothetical protein